MKEPLELQLYLRNQIEIEIVQTLFVAVLRFSYP